MLILIENFDFQIIVLVALVAVALARPQVSEADRNAVVLRLDNDNIGLDAYSYGYETSNGIQQQETGQINQISKDESELTVRGSYTYRGPDGIVYTVNYIADRNGFQPQGAHIPS